MALAAVLAAWATLVVTFVVMRLRTPASTTGGRGGRSRDARAVYGFIGQIAAIAIVTLWRRQSDAPFLDLGDNTPRLTTGIVILAVSAAVAGVRAMVALGRVWPVGARMPDDIALRTTGPYGRVRHPLYSAVFGLLLATGLAWSTLEATLVALWIYAIATHVRAGREEKLLSSALGTGYGAYASRVPRFFPRLWSHLPNAVAREAAFISTYTVVYLLYLFVYQEGELLHWVSLVLLPVSLLPLLGVYRSLGSVLDSIGLSGARAGRGWIAVSVAGAAFVAVQLANGVDRAALVAALRAPHGWLLPPVALLLLVCSSATTEEVFFRGLLQARLASRLNVEWAGWLISSVAFALYHLVYAWFATSEAMTSHAADALQIAAFDGLVPGLAIGIVYWRSGRNLLAAIALHAIVELIPAVRIAAALVHQ